MRVDLALKGIVHATDMENHTIEVFSADCPTCREAVEIVRRIAGDQPVHVLDMNRSDIEGKAKQYGVQRVPAVAIDGKLAECCTQGGVREEVIRAALR